MLDQFELVGRAVADPNRIRILTMLKGGELCVCQITAVLELAAATVSKHLSLLRMAGLVRQRKDGRWIYYRLAEHGANPYAPGMLALVATLIIDGDPVLEGDCVRLAAVKEISLDVLCAPDGKAAVTAACCGGSVDVHAN